MSTAAFGKVDELLLAATAVALLTASAADATADRIDLEAADDDLAVTSIATASPTASCLNPPDWRPLT